MGEGLKVGDRVKVTHKAEHDREYPHDTVIARRANSGRSGTITDCSNARGLCFEVDTQSGKRAWFEPDELTPETLPDVIRAAHAEDVKTITGAALPPIGAKVRPKGGLHAGRVLEVMQHRGGEMLAEKGPWIGWYAPDAVTDPDGLPVEPAVPPVERRCGDGEHVRSITESAKALDRAATHWKRESSEAKQAIDGWVARCDTLRAELATEREARQAADVLARQHGEALNRAQLGEDAARLQLSRVAAAVSVVRAAWGGMVKSEVDAALAALDRALAGVPAPVAPEEPREYEAELTVGFGEWKGTARRLSTPADEPRRWRLEVPIASAEDWREKTHAIGSGIGRDRLAATIGGWVGRVVVNERRPLREGRVMELDVLEWSEPRECQVEIPRPVVPLGAEGLERPAGEVTLSAVSDHVAAIDQRLLAVELEQTRRPRVGPWVTPEGCGEVLQAFDERGGMVAQVHPNASGGVEWMAARPFEDRMIGRAADYPAGCAAALASLSTWCDVAPEPREP